jgi:hypothetical protein
MRALLLLLGMILRGGILRVAAVLSVFFFLFAIYAITR